MGEIKRESGGAEHGDAGRQDGARPPLGDGQEALALYRELKPDLIMTDVYMPKMDGIQLTQAIRQENSDIPIIILSGYDELENARKAMRWGVDHFLLKPASVPEIETAIREATEELEAREQQQRLTERYARTIDEMKPYMREKLFQELLVTRYQKDEIPEERLQYLDIPNASEVLAICLQITRPAFLTKLEERDWQLLKFGSDNIIRELLDQQLAGHPEIYGYVLDYSDDLFVVVLLHSKQDEKLLGQIALQLAEKITEKILTYLKSEAVAGIGTVKQGLHSLLDSYLEGRKALEAAEFQGMGRVYRFAEVKKMAASTDLYTAELKQLEDVLQAKDFGKAKTLWQHLYEKLLNSEGKLTDIQTICISLFSSLMTFWHDQFPMNDPPITVTEFLQKIQRYFWPRELVDWMNGIVLQWIELCEQEFYGKKGHHLVEKVKQYVLDHFSEDISFANIARELYVHPKYLSQLFKRTTGENFVSYLNRYRIQKAIEYFQSGRHLVYEVSEMVGFKNPTYFSQVFKSITGKRPSEFLKNM